MQKLITLVGKIIDILINEKLRSSLWTVADGHPVVVSGCSPRSISD